MSAVKICMRCIVSGHVQGVAYRATTQRQALALHITGYARNLPNGNVEVLACGDAPNVRALCDWLWEGPRLAQVTDVQCTSASDTVAHGFRTL